MSFSIPQGMCQYDEGEWTWTLNHASISFDALSSMIYCLDARDTIGLEFQPKEQVDSLTYLWTGVELWIQAYISKPIFMGKFQAEKAQKEAQFSFCLVDLVDMKSLPPGESALSAALLIKPVLIIDGSTVAQTIEIPKDFQDVTITLVRECGN
ncbi:MAG: hypothetical protein AAF587_12110 [Bacteroidota bacterium]